MTQKQQLALIAVAEAMKEGGSYMTSVVMAREVEEAARSGTGLHAAAMAAFDFLDKALVEDVQSVQTHRALEGLKTWRLYRDLLDAGLFGKAEEETVIAELSGAGFYVKSYDVRVQMWSELNDGVGGGFTVRARANDASEAERRVEPYAREQVDEIVERLGIDRPYGWTIGDTWETGWDFSDQVGFSTHSVERE